MPESCSIPGCTRKHLARGWCGTHYRRWEKHGDPMASGPRVARRDLPLAEKLLLYSEPGPGGCRLWTRGKDSWGYGSLSGRGAHVLAYETWIGPVPEGLEVDHLCFVRHCIEPAHLEAVPQLINLRRRRKR